MMRHAQTRVIGRYLLCSPIASGGMATVHLGRLLGPQGFSRTVAIKQLHSELVHDPDFVTMFLDEARLTSRIRHPNVVAPLDVVEVAGEVFIVMEYVHGEPLSRLLRASGGQPVPPRIASAVLIPVLLGLHAAHEATDSDGQPLCMVHRDVSPQNILVGDDGQVRVVDFGIAKAARRMHSTSGGTLKGKLGYMAPEQVRLEHIDRRCDVFAAGIVAWEMLTGESLFSIAEPAAVVLEMLKFTPKAASTLVPGLCPELDAVVLKALALDREQRFADAKEMAHALEAACAPASAIEVSAWVDQWVGSTLKKRSVWVSEVEALAVNELTLPHAARALARPGTSASQREEAAAAVLSTPSGARVTPSSRRVESDGLSLIPTSTGASRPRSWGLPKPPRRTLYVSLILGAGVAASGYGLWLRTRSVPPPSPATVTALDPEPVGPVAGVPTPPSSSSAAALSAQTSPPAAPALMQSPPLVPSAAPKVRASTPSTKLTASAASSTRRNSVPSAPKRPPKACEVPYVVDAQGIKRFRPECF